MIFTPLNALNALPVVLGPHAAEVGGGFSTSRVDPERGRRLELHGSAPLESASLQPKTPNAERRVLRNFEARPCVVASEVEHARRLVTTAATLGSASAQHADGARVGG